MLDVMLPARLIRALGVFLESAIGATIVGMKTEVETQVISRSPDIMSGTPVFAGTRVPIQTIIDYLAGGHPLDDS